MRTEAIEMAASDEYVEYSTALRRGDPIAALEASYRRHDRVISNAASVAKDSLACTKGCNYCCYFRVDVRADEAIVIAKYVTDRMEVKTRHLVVEAALRNAEVIESLSSDEHLRTNIKCCFLVDGACSVYAVRPYACRNFHSSDVSSCIKSLNEPDNMSVSHAYVQEVQEAGMGHREGREAAAKQVGLDMQGYDLTTAVLEVLNNGAVGKRFRNGKRALIKAKVVF